MNGIKTENQVERDFYGFVCNSTLGKAVSGKVCRSGMRPANADSEDIVVKFLAGLDEQIQSGVVIINVYVPDILDGGRKVKDFGRIGTLESLIAEFVQDVNFSPQDYDGYRIETDGTPSSMQVEGIEQHVIYARIKFNRLAQ